MNSILKPQPQIGVATINNLTGGEINMDKILPPKAYHAPIEALSLFSNKDLRELIEELNSEIRELPKRYSVKNGIVKEVKDFDMEVLEKRNDLEARRKACFKIINRRNRKHSSFKKVRTLSVQYKITSSMNRGIFKNFVYEMNEGDNMKRNKVHVEKKINEETGDLEEIITKECIIPYTREGKIQKRDLFILHKSGRLGMQFNNEMKLTSEYGLLGEEEILEVFKIAHKKGAKFFVVLPKGGRRKKEYGDIPMPSLSYYKKGSILVPIEKVVKKVYIPEIDGRTPKAKEAIQEYRGSTDGYGPIYQYDEIGRIRDFCPRLLSYNYVDFNQKLIVLIGTKERIEYIDNRIEKKNSIKNGYHKFTDERTIRYEGQTSRCENRRIVPTEDGVQVFGLNLKGTPEEELKGYLRSFDRIPERRNNEEVKEFLEIAQEVNGVQTLLNIEYDIRAKIKHIRTRSSKELYYLILGVEEEIDGIPTKKEQALLNVLHSYKSSREIEENEGKGLTSDIEDLVTVEEKANDSSYKRSKNLFSQKLGVLVRNQNPLMMDGSIELYKPWKATGLPISFPRNEKLPKRNIPFVKRSSLKRFEFPIRTMFVRDLNYQIKTEKVKTENGGFISKEVGVKIESEPLFYSSSPKGLLEQGVILLEKEFEKCVKLSKIKPYKLNIREYFAHLARELEADEEASKKYWNNYISEVLSPKVVKSQVPNRVTGYHVPTPKGVKGSRKLSTSEKYIQNNGCVSTIRLFDNRQNPGPVMKKVTYEQFVKLEQKPYQYGKKVFKQTGEVKMKDGSIIRTGEYVRISHNPSSFKIIHTVGNKKGKADHYIIEINGQVLYAKGDLSLLSKKLISFTGTRNPKEVTKKVVKETIRLLYKKDDYVTISGGAKGCDMIVHNETVKNKGKTIMVLAGGFNHSIKKCKHILENGGLVLSEHPNNYIPTKGDFIKRNKIIAFLSDRLIVFEAGNGTMHCARFGMELGKELLVQPGFKRNNTLIDILRRHKIGDSFYPIEGNYPF